MPKVINKHLAELLEKANEAREEAEKEEVGSPKRIKHLEEAAEKQEQYSEKLKEVKERYVPEREGAGTEPAFNRPGYVNPSLHADDTQDDLEDDINDDELDENGDPVDYQDDIDQIGALQSKDPRPDLPSRLSRLHEHLSEVRNETLKTTLRTWFQSDGKWDATAIAALTTAVGAGQLTTVAIQTAFLEATIDMKKGFEKYKTKAVSAITERPGVTKEVEYSRPFNEVEYALGEGADHEYAMLRGARRLAQLVTTDIQLAKTKTAQDMLSHSKVQRYRRVIGSAHPCALCLLASTQVYYHEDLMPIHPGCECDVEPIEGEEDPRDIWIPREYLKDTNADGEDDNQKTGKAGLIQRYLQGIANQFDDSHELPDEPVDLDQVLKVRDHGEMGPVLTFPWQKFTGPNDLPTKPSRVIPKQSDYDLAALIAPERPAGAKVLWDGPPVDHVSFGERWKDGPQLTWASQNFDMHKAQMRAGARDVQQHGYTAISHDEQKRIELGEMRLDERLASGKVTQAQVDERDFEYGRQIASVVATQKNTTAPLYRGMIMRDEDVARFEVGQRLSSPLSSYGPSKKEALDNWADPEGAYWRSKDAATGEHSLPVILQLDKGALAAPFLNRTEFATMGQFQVDSIEEATKSRPRIVHIRQTSALEADESEKLSLPGKGKGDREIEFLGKANIDLPPVGASLDEIDKWTKAQEAKQAAAAKAKSKAKGINDPAIRKQAEDQLQARFTEAHNNWMFVRDNGFDKATVKQIQDYLEEQHPESVSEVSGFDKRGIDEKAARDVLKAADDMMTKYPNAYVGRILVDDFAPDEKSVVAATYPDLFTAAKTDKVVMNRRFMLAKGRKDFQDLVDYSEATGFYFPGFADAPHYNAFVHEFGHVMDNRGGLTARISVNKDAVALYKSTLKKGQKVTLEGYKKWELNGWPKAETQRVSGYSMNGHGMPGQKPSGSSGPVDPVGTSLNNPEALAQAFEDAERRAKPGTFGDDRDASDLSAMLHDRLIEEYNKPPVDGETWNEHAANLTEKEVGLPDLTNLATERVNALQRGAQEAVRRSEVEARTVNGDVEHGEHLDLERPKPDEDAIYQAVKDNGGITIDLKGHSPNNGYAYAPYKGTEKKVSLKTFSQKHIDDYIDEHYEQLSLPGNNLGIWSQDGYAYLDVSRVGTASAKTIKAAQDADQLAVFDLKHFNEIETGTIADGKYTPIGKASDVHREYRRKIAAADERDSGASVSEVSGDAGASATGPPGVKDPLLDLLGDAPKPQADKDAQDILDMLGVKDAPAPAPAEPKPEKPVDPIPGVPVGWERYYQDMMAREDTSKTPGVVNLNTKDLVPHREYDRSGTDQDVVTKAIKDSATEKSPKGVIKTPIQLQVDKHGNAMIAEGNHRLQAARELGITKIPVRIKQVDEIVPNDVGSRGGTKMSDKFKDVVDTSITKANLAIEKAAEKARADQLEAAEKAKGFGYVEKRLPGEGYYEPKAVVTPKGTVDVGASWAAIDRDKLKENWRKAIRDSQDWAKKAGAAWYPGVHEMTTRMTRDFGDEFEKRWGVKMTPDLAAAFFAAYSENNNWAGNLVGVRKFLDGSGTQYLGKLADYHYEEASDYAGITAGKYGSKYSIPSDEEPKYDENGKSTNGVYKIPGVEGNWKNYDFHVNKAIRAIQNPRGGVADLRENAITAPKPADFAANIAGDYSKATSDRWVARILLHTDDTVFAEKMRNYAPKSKGVVTPEGYNNMSQILQEVAEEPEFAHLNAAAVQAIPWVQVVGPLGSIGYIDDLSSYSTVVAETLKRAAEFGDVK